MSTQTLKNKIIDIFGVYVPEGQSNDQTFKDINKRGKIDMVKITKIIFLLIDELETLQKLENKPPKETTASKKMLN